jgi:hypothetical protein
LAYTATWLDPIGPHDDDEWFPEDEDGTLTIALRITRENFSDLYVQALDLLRGGAGYMALDRLICGALTARGLPVDSLEFLGFGIPLPAYGVTLEEPEFYESQPDMAAVLACFGITPEPNPYSIDVPDCAYQAGHLLARSLLDHAEQRWQQVGWLLSFLFSSSGNSTVDLSYELQAELQPLGWTPDEVAFALEIIREADAIMADVHAACQWLNAQPQMLAALQANIKLIYRKIEEGMIHERTDAATRRLEWPRAASGAD